MRPAPLPRVLLLLALAGGAGLAAGCATVQAPPSALMQRVGKSDLRPEELRIRVRALAPRFSGQLEYLADSIAAQAGDTPTYAAMLRFKVNALPALQAALFQPDPVAALVDTWALVAQLQDVVARTPVGDTPAVAALAVPRFAAMERELEVLWKELTGKASVADTRAKVHAWARDNPIVDSVAARPSTTALLSRLTAQAGIGALASAGQLLETTQDLTARLDLQTAFLPKQGRWQAESFLLSALSSPTYRDAVPELPAMMQALQGVTEQVQALPWLVAREREAVLAGVREERLGVQAFATGEREQLVSTLQAERAVVLAEADRTVQRGVDHAFDRAQRLVDRMFLWFAGLLLLAVLGGALLALLLLRAWRHRPAHPLAPRREAHA